MKDACKQLCITWLKTLIIIKYKLPPSAFTPAKQVQWNPFEQTKKSVRENLHFQLHQIFTVKWKEPNRPQRPNRPQFLEGRFGTCWAVLDRKSQNSSRWYQFGPSNFWIGYTKSQFGTSSQFGPSDSQIKIPIWPQQGLRGQTAFCRQKGRKETEVFGWSNYTSDTNQSTVRLVEQGTKITLT